MGILRYGEKRMNEHNGDVKDITVKKIGWKRIAKNTCRFGWVYVNPDPYGDSDEIIEPFSKKGKTRVELLFVRPDNIKAGNPSVRVQEFFYNLIFLIRRIVAFLLPILFLVGIVVSTIKREEGIKTAVIVCLTAFLLWIACIIAEGIIARCAESKIKSRSKKTTVRKNETNRQTSSDSRTAQASDYALNPPEDTDGYITLQGKDGKKIDFYEVAGIFYRGNSYAIMQPVELLEDMKEGEALVFKVTRDGNGEDKFEVELDDKIIDAVFVEYNRLLDEAEGKTGT